MERQLCSREPQPARMRPGLLCVGISDRCLECRRGHHRAIPKQRELRESITKDCLQGVLKKGTGTASLLLGAE